MNKEDLEGRRNERLHPDKAKQSEERSPSERDHDRILYSSAFLRLAGVTQVAHSEDQCIVHNRLIHSLKVARLGRGLAVRLSRQQPDMVDVVGGIDPSTVEAASLAHDIGHPPFGHVAEDELNKLVQNHSSGTEFDAFEGNAQSFRVVTKLATRDFDYSGLNLTRATLNAMQKYPWHRGAETRKSKKWGAYIAEEEEFNWTRKFSSSEGIRCAEAELMDWADDVAYATHDLEDYYRVGLVPLDQLMTSFKERERFLNGTFSRWKVEGVHPEAGEEELSEAFDRITKIGEKVAPAELKEPYSGSRRQRAAIHTFTSLLINQFLGGIELKEPTQGDPKLVKVDRTKKLEITILKSLMFHYVLRNPNLAAVEFGQRSVIKGLYKIFSDEADNPASKIFSERYREQLNELKQISGNEGSKCKLRIIVDMVAELTEHRAYQLYKTLTGNSVGSVLDYAQR